MSIKTTRARLLRKRRDAMRWQKQENRAKTDFGIDVGAEGKKEDGAEAILAEGKKCLASIIPQLNEFGNTYSLYHPAQVSVSIFTKLSSNYGQLWSQNLNIYSLFPSSFHSAIIPPAQRL